MIRIYMTNSGIEGYHEGCSCCSFAEHATKEDIKKLVKGLHKQASKLESLSILLDMHGEEKLTYWFNELEKLKDYEARLDGAKKYQSDPEIQGTYWKECFENLEENTKEYNLTVKNCKRIPAAFKNYLADE